MLTVMVPSYQRSTDLRRCLEALGRQERRPEEIIVIARVGDHATRDVARGASHELPGLRVVDVSEPGVVAAMNEGIRAARGRIIALTDDDAAPRPDWLARMMEYFETDPLVAGVGGRDWLHEGGTIVDGGRRIVGKLQWFGRCYGNHHLGVGGPREVDVLKGVNCAFRREPLVALGFDTRLRGAGAQVHWELSLCLKLRRSGWKLIYDPAIAVDHYLASRVVEGRVGSYVVEDEAVFNAAYNEALVIWEHLGFMSRIAYVVWSLLIGDTSAPGILQAIRYSPAHGRVAWRRFRVTQSGKLCRLREVAGWSQS